MSDRNDWVNGTGKYESVGTASEPDDDSSLECERIQRTAEEYMGCLVEECLADTRLDLENCGLSEAASTAAKMTLEMFSRLWYERRQNEHDAD